MIEKTEMHINNLCTYNGKVLNHFIYLMIHVGIKVHVARIFQRKYITRSIRGYMIKKKCNYRDLRSPNEKPKKAFCFLNIYINH